MLKQIIAIIAISILVILGMNYAQQILQGLITAHDWVAQALTEVFSGGDTGNLIRKLIALLTLPVLISAIPVVIFWFAKRRFFPYFMQFVWVIWLVQTAVIIVQFKAAAP